MEAFSSPFVTRPAATKMSHSSSSADVGGSVTKRLSSELMSLMMSASPGISAFPKSDANLFEWVGTIEGPVGTVYKGLAYKINISFPANYPFVAPTIKFDASTTCYHPNVDLQGNICLDILQDKWSAVYSVNTILISLQSLLGEPNNSSPLNTDAAGLWNYPEEYKAQVMRYFRAMDDGA